MASTSPNGGRPAPAHGPAAARRARAAAVLGWLALWQLAAWAVGRPILLSGPGDAAAGDGPLAVGDGQGAAHIAVLHRAPGLNRADQAAGELLGLDLHVGQAVADGALALAHQAAGGLLGLDGAGGKAVFDGSVIDAAQSGCQRDAERLILPHTRIPVLIQRLKTGSADLKISDAATLGNNAKDRALVRGIANDPIAARVKASPILRYHAAYVPGLLRLPAPRICVVIYVNIVYQPCIDPGFSLPYRIRKPGKIFPGREKVETFLVLCGPCHCVSHKNQDKQKGQQCRCPLDSLSSHSDSSSSMASCR